MCLPLAWPFYNAGSDAIRTHCAGSPCSLCGTDEVELVLKPLPAPPAALRVRSRWTPVPALALPRPPCCRSYSLDRPAEPAPTPPVLDELVRPCCALEGCDAGGCCPCEEDEEAGPEVKKTDEGAMMRLAR